MIKVSCGIISINDRVLVVRRSSTDRFNPFFWEFPGGKVDEGENFEDVFDSARDGQVALCIDGATVARMEGAAREEFGRFFGLLVVALRAGWALDEDFIAIA